MKCIWVLFVLAALTPFTAAQNEASVKQAESACGPLNVRFNVKTSANLSASATAQAGKAEVYVIEEWAPSGAPTGFENPIIRVGMDSHWMGAGQGNSYSLFTVEPGEHHLCVHWQPDHFEASHATTALYAFNAKPDRTYFFRVRMPGLPNAFGILHSVTFGILLDPINVDEGQLLVAKYPRATSTVKK